MLPKILKWVGIALGSLLVLAALLVFGLNAAGNARLTKKYEVQVETVVIPTDEASVEKGKYRAASLCMDCHGEDFSGKPLVDDPVVGYIPSPNITTGKGGISEYTDADWIRALRHGIDPKGRAFLAMPSMDYYYLSDEDLGSIIAYFKTLPPVDHDTGEANVFFMGKSILAAGGLGKYILPAEAINHTGARPPVIKPEVSAEYGGYLVQIGGCHVCHGDDLKGGQSPEPGSPPAPSLVATEQWTQENFMDSVRTRQSETMPWKDLRPLNDSDLQAMYLYLQSLAQ